MRLESINILLMTRDDAEMQPEIPDVEPGMLEPRSKRVLLLDYATTSAALKLLLLRRTLRKLGRSDFDAGLTTEPALFATQVPAALTIAAAAAGDSCTDPVEL